jgi:hypothetical protein
MKLKKCSMLLLSLVLAGCFATRTTIVPDTHFNVFGIELNSSVDYRKINNEVATEEPCLRGYERNFEKSGITVGYGFDGRIRKISTQNPTTSLFGISPGMAADEGKRLARQAGFMEVSPYKYTQKEISLTLLVDNKGKVFGVKVER